MLTFIKLWLVCKMIELILRSILRPLRWNWNNIECIMIIYDLSWRIQYLSLLELILMITCFYWVCLVKCLLFELKCFWIRIELILWVNIRTLLVHSRKLVFFWSLIRLLVTMNLRRMAYARFRLLIAEWKHYYFKLWN